MSVRRPEASGLSTRQRLCLLHGTQLSAEKVLSMDESEFTYEFITQNGIKAQSITAAGLGPKKLKEMGLQTPEQLRSLGFDSLYMADPKFASECNLCFGSEAVVMTFLQNASDAVAIAGSDAVQILNIATLDMLQACAGSPTEAFAVLQQLPLGISLLGVPASALLDCGIRRTALQELGYSLTAVANQTGADATQLAKLGFSFT